MLPSHQELFELDSSRRRQREAEALVERQWRPRRVRARTASLLRALADRIAPVAPGASAHGDPAGRYS
jgi:hypothetical protein